MAKEPSRRRSIARGVKEEETWLARIGGRLFQNVHVRQGPVQRYFGISTIVMESAGAAEGEGHNQHAVGNKAIMEGIHNPEEIRELILERVRQSRSVGLGDEPQPGAAISKGWSAKHQRALREILDEIRGLD